MPEPSESIDEHFSGKRAADRAGCSIPVALLSGRRRMDGEVVNLSRSGVLIRIPYRTVTNSLGGRRIGGILGLVDRQLGGAFQVEFAGGLALPVSLVRMVVEVDEPGAFRLGCEFREALSEETYTSIVGSSPSPPS